MHVRTTPGHVPQCRCLEGAFIGLVLCHGVATEVRVGLIHSHADIAVILVGEVEPRVTAYTTCLTLEERETALGFRRQGALVSRLEAIVGRISRNNCPYIGGDGLGYSDRLKVVAEDLAELFLVGRNRPQVFHHLLVCPVEVLQRLLLERRPQTCPELSVAEKSIHDRNSVTGHRLAREINRELPRITPAVVGLMAAHAGYRSRC